MERDFREALISLVMREMASAQKANDDDRAAGVVTDLAEQLGKAIAMLCRGDRRGIDTLLAGTENLVSEIAFDTANFLTAMGVKPGVRT